MTGKRKEIFKHSLIYYTLEQLRRNSDANFLPILKQNVSYIDVSYFLSIYFLSYNFLS